MSIGISEEHTELAASLREARVTLIQGRSPATSWVARALARRLSLKWIATLHRPFIATGIGERFVERRQARVHPFGREKHGRPGGRQRPDLCQRPFAGFLPVPPAQQGKAADTDNLHELTHIAPHD